MKAFVLAAVIAGGWKRRLLAIIAGVGATLLLHNLAGWSMNESRVSGLAVLLMAGWAGPGSWGAIGVALSWCSKIFLPVGYFLFWRYAGWHWWSAIVPAAGGALSVAMLGGLADGISMRMLLNRLKGY